LALSRSTVSQFFFSEAFLSLRRKTLSRVGNKKPTQKNPKYPPKKPNKNVEESLKLSLLGKCIKNPKNPTGLFFFLNPGIFQPCLEVPELPDDGLVEEEADVLLVVEGLDLGEVALLGALPVAWLTRKH
jgi:hypothetical protein